MLYDAILTGVIILNQVPMKGEHIVDLTIASSTLKNKIFQWKFRKEVFLLKSDHMLVSFSFVGDEEEATE